MARPTKHLGWILAAASALLAACGAPHVIVACDVVGAASGIQIDYADVLRHNSQAITVSACVNDVCGGQIVPSGQNRLSNVTLGGRTLHDARPVPVSLVIIDGTGRDVFRGDVAVAPHTDQPKDSALAVRKRGWDKLSPRGSTR